jgi:glucokinase
MRGTDTPIALGIDIGGTKIAAALVDSSGTILARERGPVAPESNAVALRSIFSVIDRVLDTSGTSGTTRRRLAGIGAGAPGNIDWRAGVLRGATNLAWRDLPLAEALGERYGVPALLDNDVNVAAWGEFCFGTGVVPLTHLVFIAVGTGIGSGIVESGRLIRGQRSAGEIGHIPLLEHGPRCKCGLVGCLEAVAAGPALGAAGRALLERGESPGIAALLQKAGDSMEEITAAHIFAAAQAGDAGAQRLVDREGYYVALAVLIAARMLDPERIVIGGGLADAGSVFFEAIWANLARLRPRGPDPRQFVVRSQLGVDAGAVGAAALILRPEPSFAEAGLINPGAGA